MGKPSTNTVTQQSSPPPEVMANYRAVTNEAGNVAGQPYTPYSGSLVAGFTPQQQAAFGNVNQAAGLAQPYIGQAANLVGAATSGINPTATLGQFNSPYTAQVTQATQDLFNQQNKQQSNSLTGNAIAAGAYGGDRAAVAQGVLAGQQQAQEAPVLANIQQAGYNQALQTGLQTQEANAWLNSQGAFALGQLGSEAQGQALSGANAQLAIGNQQQGLAQNELNVPYQAYSAAQAYPYQTTGWLAGIDEGLGSQMGGQSSTSSPGPSWLSQAAGLGLTAAGGYNLLGGAAGIASLFGAADGGAIRDHYDLGGPVTLPTPPDVSVTFVPSAQMSTGHATIPAAPQPYQAPDPLGLGMQAMQFANGVNGGNGDSGGALKSSTSGTPGFAPDTSVDGWQAAAARGGAIHRDDGGATPDLEAGLGASSGAEGISPVLAAGMGSGNPMVAGLLQRYQSLPTEQLREMAVRFPPSTPQGQMVQTMLRRRQMTPQADPTTTQVPTSVAQAAPIAGLARGGMPPMRGFYVGGMALPRFDDGGVPTIDPDQFADTIRDKGEATPGGETSSKGATGIMQVMPATAASPGFGITPSNGTPDDTVRLGRDYAKTMLQHYGNDPVLGAAAYNAGPGQVDKWIAQFGDPRKGEISDKDFAARLPFDETRNYVGRVAGMGAPQPQQFASAPAGTAGMASSDPYAVNYTPRSTDASDQVKSLRDNARGMALLQAGLSILGGTSPFAGVNIGKGATAGLQSYERDIQEANALQEKQAQAADTGNYRMADLRLNSQKDRDAAAHAAAALAQQGTYQQGELANQRARLALEQTPADVRTFQAVQHMPPEQQAAYYNAEAVKKGLLPMYTADQFRTSAASPPANGAPSPAASATATGGDFLKTLPTPVQEQVLAIAQGRRPLPGRLTPQTEQLIQLVGQYDPTFDATDYNKRNRTATDFSAGQSNKAVSAINTAMAHLDTLQSKFDTLNNGSVTPLNWIENQVQPMFGDSRVNNAMQARDAVANELRKVFATTGGGGLEELRGWQDRFPINGSPKQQHDAVVGAIELMNGRLSALADRYNQGMGTNHSSVDLLSPEARKSYEHLTGQAPSADQSRPQTYAAPGSGAQGVTPQPGQQPAQGTAGAPAIPAMADRKAGSVYPTPKGPMTWTGTGWVPAQAQP